MRGHGADVSRSSRVTYREQPVQAAASLAGSVVVRSETLTVDSESRFELVDVTGAVLTLVQGLGIREGLVNLFSLHTTCSVFINEQQAALQTDIKRFLEAVVDRDADWMHNDPAHSDCDRFNADAHLRALLLGPSLTLQVSGGELVLGQWQRVLVAELDGPRSRSIRVMVMGTS
jgi:secondary thiamine-phosphate synthase enzyme